MNKIIIFLSIFLLSLSVVASDLNLVVGKSRGDLPKSLLKTIYRTYTTLPGYLYEYSPNKYYSLSKTGNAIGVFDLANTDEILSGWPLTPWPQTIQMKGEGSNWQTRHLVANALAGNTAEVKDPETMALATYQYDLPSFKTFTGCLADSPLRYGDIDQNSEKELVLFLDNDLVVFSPSQQKVIFATRFAMSDELAPEDVAGWFDGGLEPPSNQYVASSGFGDGLRAAFPATRSFAKIFVDDFDNNGKPDILVWRKLYQSRLKTDPLLGFKFEGELFAHYQLENGEYVIQATAAEAEGEFETDPAQQLQIKNWLAAKNLTWQKGFPSKSECAGQEGQLIPEMHDALLNDPDVLK